MRDASRRQELWRCDHRERGSKEGDRGVEVKERESDRGMKAV